MATAVSVFEHTLPTSTTNDVGKWSCICCGIYIRKRRMNPLRAQRPPTATGLSSTSPMAIGIGTNTTTTITVVVSVEGFAFLSQTH